MQSEHKKRKPFMSEGGTLSKTDFAVFSNRNSNKGEHRLLDQSRKCFTGLRINIHATQHLYFHTTLTEIQTDRLDVSVRLHCCSSRTAVTLPLTFGTRTQMQWNRKTHFKNLHNSLLVSLVSQMFLGRNFLYFAATQDSIPH